MKVEVQKWGNSAAIRLPATVLRQMRVQLGQTVEMSYVDGKLILEPQKTYHLDVLLAQITPENSHDLQFDDAARGHESW